MKCPKCDGMGRVQYGTGVLSEEGGEQWDEEECPHCDSTGEIKAGQWWMCRHLDYGSSLPVLFEKDEWTYALERWPADILKPLYRMKKAGEV